MFSRQLAEKVHSYTYIHMYIHVSFSFCTCVCVCLCMALPLAFIKRAAQSMLLLVLKISSSPPMKGYSGLGLPYLLILSLFTDLMGVGNLLITNETQLATHLHRPTRKGHSTFALKNRLRSNKLKHDSTSSYK